MFGARKKFVEFVEVVDNDFTDESMYYNQPSMFPHRSDKDVSLFPLSAHFCHFVQLKPVNTFPCYLPCPVFKCFLLDAFLTLTIVVRSAVAARCKFVRSTK